MTFDDDTFYLAVTPGVQYYFALNESTFSVYYSAEINNGTPDGSV